MKRMVSVILFCALLLGLSFSEEVQKEQGAAPVYESSVLFTFGGDCVLGNDRGHAKHPQSFDNVVLQNGLDWPFSKIKHIFENDDFTLLNLECVLQDNENGFKKRQHNFRGKTEYVNMLVNADVEGVNVANNHFIDYTRSGKKSTIAALEKAGVFYSGYGYLDIREINGYKVGFGGIRETTYRQKPDIVKREIEKLKKEGCDIIVYSMHFGREYDRTHNKLQKKMAHQAIDLGADIVIGNHVHVVQGIETYKDGLIFYSFGNLVFGGNRNLTEFEAMLAQLRMSKSKDGHKKMELTIIPVLTTGAMPENDFCPIIAEGKHKQSVLDKIQADSSIPIKENMLFTFSPEDRNKSAEK